MDGRLGAEHRLGELFKHRYDKLSTNHIVTDPVPVGVTSVDNPADSTTVVKNPADSLMFLLPPIYWRVLIF